MISFSSGAVAGDRDGTAIGDPVALRGHSEPLLVVFGAHVEFKHYFLVNLLSQFMAVATDVKGGVRYDLHETSEGRMLVID